MSKAVESHVDIKCKEQHLGSGAQNLPMSGVKIKSLTGVRRQWLKQLTQGVSPNCNRADYHPFGSP